MEKLQRKPNAQCNICAKPIYRRPAQLKSGPVYCSSKCYGKSTEKLHKCAVCDNLIHAHKHKKTCSRACANKQKIGLKYGLRLGRPPKDGIKEARLLKQSLIELRGNKCERCPYAKLEILVVHHKIERCNGGTNDLDNLELICPNCHAEEHYNRRMESKP